MPESKKPPIINCHIHMFTGDYVPAYLAKTFLPWPLYYLLSLRFVITFLRWYHAKIKPLFYKNTYKSFKRFLYNCEMFFKRHFIWGFLKFIIETYLIVATLFYIGIWLLDINYDYQNFIKKWAVKALVFFKDSGWIIVVTSLFYKLVFFIFITIFFKSIRNLAIAALKQFKVLPGKHVSHLFQRYVQIGLFSKYKLQSGIYNKLKKQYPIDTHFVGLPMDMEFMKAGKIKTVYDSKTRAFIKIPKLEATRKRDPFYAINHQMEGILKIKKRNQDTFHPFVFADPRRMTDSKYFDFTVKTNGDVELVKGCLMQTYLEVYKFSGIKIYPALGYYPFDDILLPLWKYAQQHNLPIMTHCIKGTIFYRGKKEPKWDNHPIFTEGKINTTKKQKVLDEDDLELELKSDLDINADYIDVDNENNLHLNAVKNIEFCNNFTNPLNYLCLLDEKLLYQVIQKSASKDVLSKIFKCNSTTKTVENGGLKKLKICFAHFGGDDQWKRFLESDRDNYTSQLILKPKNGVDFFNNAKGNPSPGKLAYIWKYVDWYTIICSIILQYDNIYADISYILHDPIILPLLKQTLSNEGLMPKVLYGSDFYVVRNHNSDKEILADMRAGLTEVNFDQIARFNPRAYLNLV